MRAIFMLSYCVVGLLTACGGSNQSTGSLSSAQSSIGTRGSDASQQSISSYAVMMSSSPVMSSSSARPLSSSAMANSQSSASSIAACLDFNSPQSVGKIANTSLSAGPSGIVASRQNANVLYGHLDAGGPGTVFAMATDGSHLGAFMLAGISQVDWEDIAVGPGPSGMNHIYVGDIGDNAARQGGNARKTIIVYRFLEPSLTTTTAQTTTITDFERLIFTYPDKPHDAETLMVDPVSGDILILTKEDDGISSLYRAASDTPAETSTALELITTVTIGASGQGGQASAGDISPSGDRFIIRSYTTILLWQRGKTLAATFAVNGIVIPSATEPQSEGITFSGDGQDWYSAGERASAIYHADTHCP